MIEFVTLFLGLVLGPQTVEVAVGGDVARVELKLDGEIVEVLENAPWSVEVDLGEALRPQELTAIGLDSAGREVARATQQLNLPRPPAEAGIVLEMDGEGRPEFVRLTWQSVARSRPSSIHVRLDGEELVVPDLERIPLPDLSMRELHVLEAELQFGPDAFAQAYLAFGGAYGQETTTRLTALPIRLDGRRGRLPDAVKLNGWFEIAGAEPSAVAVEKGPAELLVVRAEGVEEELRQLKGRFSSGAGAAPGTATGAASAGGTLNGYASASEADTLRYALSLEEGDRSLLMLPFQRSVRRNDLPMGIFPTSPPIAAEDGGLHWLLGLSLEMPGLEDRQRLADAVAVAGLRAATGNRRRAVLLVLPAGAEDGSALSAAAVRGYLASLGVPLHVWTLGSAEPSPADGGWGEVRNLRSWNDLRSAMRHLTRELDRQRVVWLEGRHRADLCRLTPRAGQISLLR